MVDSSFSGGLLLDEWFVGNMDQSLRIPHLLFVLQVHGGAGVHLSLLEVGMVGDQLASVTSLQLCLAHGEVPNCTKQTPSCLLQLMVGEMSMVMTNTSGCYNKLKDFDATGCKPFVAPWQMKNPELMISQ